MKGYRTLAVNALSLVIILCGWDQITQYVSPEILAAILAIANALLRLITSTPVGQGVAKVVVLLLLVVPVVGCSGLALLNQDNTAEQTRAILERQNARGCIYFYGSAAPWATVKTVVVGTWGQDPPPYSECWQGLPSGF